MKVLKRILLIFLVFFVLLIGFAIAIPIIYKDSIVLKAKEEINKSVYAKVDFEDVELSLFRNFPNFTFLLEKYKVTGIEDFDGIELAKGEAAEFSINLMSLLSKTAPIKINSVSLRKPALNVLVLKNGKANYDIAVPTDERIKESAAETDYSGVRVQLKSYEITDAQIIYDDRSSDMLLEMENFNHSGSGNFTIDVFDLKTKTSIGELTFKQEGTTYLKKAKLSLDAIFNIDQKNSKYTLKDNLLTVNALQLNADGFVQMQESDILMDLKLSSPQNDFKNLWSLIPNAYTKGYEDVKIDGSFDFVGIVKGTYNESTIPAFRIQTNVKDGNVKYPDLPLGISSINAKVDVNSPSSDLNKMVVNIPRMGFKIGNNPIDGKLKISNPIADPTIDGLINGVLDLADLAKAFPMDDVEKMSGIISANVKMKARLSQIEKEEYESVDIKGEAGIKDLLYDMKGYPSIKISDAQMDFTPQMVNVAQFKAYLGESDVEASGRIDNILAYFSPEKTMTGDMKLRSNYINADEWLEEEAEGTNEVKIQSSTTSETVAEEEIFDRFDFAINADVKKLTYGEYELTNMEAKGQIAPNKMKMDNFVLNIGQSDLRGSGTILNVFDYLFKNGTLGGSIRLESDLFDLNQFMTADGEVPENSGNQSVDVAALEPILVPENIDMKIDADFKKLLYTNMTLRDMEGELLITPKREVVINDVQAKSMGGIINMNGGYYTTDPEKPKFSMEMDLKKLDFKEAFSILNTFQTIAPIGQFMEGTFSTKMSMDGLLGNDMMPIFGSLNAEGFLHTINGLLSGFKPLNAVGNALNIDELQGKIKVKDSKNWFTIKEGKIEVKEFDYVVKDVKMKIAGSHGLDNEMDYGIKAAIPRKLLDKAGLGKLAETGLKSLSDQASKLGLDLKQSDVVNVLINLTGSMTDPKVKFKLLGTDGETSLVDAAKSTISDAVDDKKEAIKEDLSGKAQKILDDAQKRADKLTSEAKTTADKIRSEGQNAADKINSEAKKAADKVRAEGQKKAGQAKRAAADEAKKQVDKAKNPIAKLAAKKVADRLVKEADKKADQFVVEANKKADGIESEADKRANQTTATAEKNAKKVEDTAAEKSNKIMEEAQKQVDRLK